MAFTLAKRTATDRDLQDNITTYQYNPAGRLISVTTPLGTEQISYDKAGRITAKSNETSGISKTYSYYTGGLVKRIDTLRDNTLIFYEYNEYNPAGNKTYTDLNGNVTEYTYDGLNRLASTTENGKITSYEFDEYNNISSKYELTDTTLTTTSYFYDNNNRLLLEESGNNYIRYEYDHSGNLLQKMPSSGADSYYKYDGYGRLTEVITGDSVAEYTYAPDGLRQSKTVNGKYTRFVYENGSVSAEITEGNTYNYYRGTELMGYTSHTGDLYYYISDSHGNIVSVTDVLGVHKKDYSYDAYGNKKAFSINPQGDMSVVYQWQSENENIYNPFRYCGEYTDEETGFVYLRNRYYDSSVGRFITEDPHWNTSNMIYGDDEPTDTKKKIIKIPDIDSIMQSGNLYVYCMNNPMMYVDPSGEVADWVILALYGYVQAIVTSPDLQYDMQMIAYDISHGDYVSAAFGIVDVLLPGVSGSKFIPRFIKKYFDDVVDWVRGFQTAKVNKILSNAQFVRKTKGGTYMYDAVGGYKEAVKDFNYLKLKNVTKYDNGTLAGVMADGTKVNVHTSSTDGGKWTLEIGNKKIRYVE